MKYWWCNQSRDWGLERKAGVVCSTDRMDRLTYRETVNNVCKGDIIVHYKKPYVVAVSRAKEDARHYEQLPLVSGVDYGSGWRFKTEYFDLSEPINRSEFADNLIPLIVKHYPVDTRGYIRQGYFFPFDDKGIRIVLSPTDQKLPEWIVG